MSDLFTFDPDLMARCEMAGALGCVRDAEDFVIRAGLLTDRGIYFRGKRQVYRPALLTGLGEAFLVGRLLAVPVPEDLRKPLA